MSVSFFVWRRCEVISYFSLVYVANTRFAARLNGTDVTDQFVDPHVYMIYEFEWIQSV